MKIIFVLLLCLQGGLISFGILRLVSGDIANGLFIIALNVGFGCLNIHTLWRSS